MNDVKRILITGAGSGLGRGLAIELATAGHHVWATDLDEDAVQKTVKHFPEGARGKALTLDVTRDEQIDALVRSLGEQPVDVLVNNAGLQHVASLESFPQKTWDRLMDVMIRGTCLMTRAVLPGMRRQGYGRIVNIGSIHALVASPYKSAYVAAKHAMVGFSKVIALETADTDITINTICPSYIRTPLVDAQITDQAIAHGISEEEVIEKIMLDPMPKKAFITVEEISGILTFLMSSHARNITGQTIVIDGGWTVR